ncbi:peptidylprolyl isomerase [Sulfurimonas marina]|uniref:Peptidylprolyl isomerase n=1 Tax=Sulfurimonas marina TaxID=2590551 RepID=A0A7M1AXZ2_9BACT|nr:peptidylprolyl isomerase [Sulfurimonas marina]
MYRIVFLFALFLSGCSLPQVAPVKVGQQQKDVSFSEDVKPILDKRCVVCHSCYNSPCQAKLSSFAGIDRGGSKIEVYNATRLSPQTPTRLFIDAKNTQEWHTKGFFSLTQNLEDTNGTSNDSIMLHLLHNKQTNPDVIGDYDPEHDTLMCPKDKEELSKYLYEKPNHGMPYGFPALKQREYITLASWLFQGAKDDHNSAVQVSKNAQKEIEKWEKFLNAQDPKHQMSARYLYEHLYLAHIYFSSAKGEFFELVRSYTPAPQPTDIIPTLRPFDDPQVEKFYYRFRKIESTIVHKTHMIMKFDDTVLARYNELFMEPEWREKPHTISYDTKISANPFIAYKQIPASSRYQFLLDNSKFIVMTFIRGPVCRGQMALNVIHDHFWVMFRDPKFDIAVIDPEFIDTQVQNLSLPIENVDHDLLKTFSDEYRERYEHYYQAKKERTTQLFNGGYPIESIYKGVKSSDSPILTVYRHFDSASVSRGVLGEEPRTMWVIDYAQFERLYYALVAGYDVFGNVSHQTNIRRYMDFLRMEGEANFLEYMPQKKRLSIMESWYINDESVVDDAKYVAIEKLNNKIVYKTDDYKHEFIEKIVNQYLPKDLNITFDRMNYKTKAEMKTLTMPKDYKTAFDYIQATRALTLPGSGFVRFMTDRGANNMLLRIEMEDGTFITKNLVINRWHDNVNSLFMEESMLDPSKDTMDFLDSFIGSYPNVFIDVKFSQLPEFLNLMKNTTGTLKDLQKFQKYFISRSDPRFWEYYDWFQKEFDRQNGVEAGLYDLNRYARTPWQKSH